MKEFLFCSILIRKTHFYIWTNRCGYWKRRRSGEGVLRSGEKAVEAGYEVSNEEMKLYGVSEVVKAMNRYCSVGFFYAADESQRF